MSNTTFEREYGWETFTKCPLCKELYGLDICLDRYTNRIESTQIRWEYMPGATFSLRDIWKKWCVKSIYQNTECCAKCQSKIDQAEEDAKKKIIED